jgi:hypothetical protein
VPNDIYVTFSADSGPLEAEAAKARAEIRSLNVEMNALGRSMQSTGASMDSTLGQQLNALGSQLSAAKGKMAELGEEIRKHREEAGGLGETFAKLGEGVTQFAELAGASFGADAFRDWIAETIEAAEQTTRMAAKLGASTTEVQKIGAIATLTGTDLDRMAMSLERMELGLAKSESAASPARAALAALGIEADKFRSLLIPAQIDELAEAFSRFADGPNKTAAAMALLGRSGADMIPALDRGREGLAELNKTAQDTAVIMSDQDVKALTETQEASNKLSLAVKALGQDIAIFLNGPSAINLVTSLATELDNATRSLRAMGAVWGAITGAIGLPDVGGGRDITVRRLDMHDRNLGAGYGGVKAQVPEMQTGRGGGRTRAPKDETANVDREQYSEEIALIEQTSREKQKSLDDDLAHHKTTIQQWLADSTASLNAELAQVRAVYDQEAAIAGLNSVQIAQIKKQEAVELQKINNQIADDGRKAADLEQKQWAGVLNGIDGELNSVLQSMLSKHQSWGQAMTKVFEDMAMKGVEEIGKIALAEAAIGIGGLLGGPIGGTIGAAGSALIPHFAVGAWELPGDTLGMVHKGEMIVPAGPAASLRDMLSGGGSIGGGGSVAIHPTVTLNHSSIDGASTAQFFRQNGAGIMKAIGEASRQGAHLGVKGLRR